MRTLTAALWLTSACTSGGDYAQAVCVIADASGTYADQLGDVAHTIRAGIIPKMLPGDSLVLVRADDDSYGEDNVIASVQLDHRPSVANRQKAAVAKKLDALKNPRRARHTDITLQRIPISLFTRLSNPLSVASGC